MKTWYRAVCDEHKEACHVLVSNPSCGAVYLSDRDQEIQEWLTKHYGCKLRLIHSDEELDALWDEYFIEDYAWTGIKQPRDKVKGK